MATPPVPRRRRRSSGFGAQVVSSTIGGCAIADLGRPPGAAGHRALFRLASLPMGSDLTELHRAADRRLGPCGSRSLAQPHMERPGRGYTGRVPACGRRYTHPPRVAFLRPDSRGARRLRRLRRRNVLRRRDHLVSPAALGDQAERRRAPGFPPARKGQAPARTAPSCGPRDRSSPSSPCSACGLRVAPGVSGLGAAPRPTPDPLRFPSSSPPDRASSVADVRPTR